MAKKTTKKTKKNVKINNKHSNKINKRKNKSKKINKQIKNSIKGTNKSLALQKAIQDQEENGVEEEVLPMDMLDDENLEFYSKNFSKKRSNKKSKFDDDDFKIEDNYKPKLNMIKQHEDVKKRKQLLPIKGDNGLVEQFMDIEEENNGKKKKEKLIKTEEVKFEANKLKTNDEPKSVVELLLEKKLFFENTKDKIGLSARAIIENPQGEMKKLKELRTMLTSPDVLKSNLLKKLLMVSLTEIFKDITPGYKIRIWSEKENEQQIGKDVKDLKDYEHSLVKQYKLFIDNLDQTLKDAHKTKNNLKTLDESASLVATKCLCDLIKSLSHFNHANDIIQIIVQNSSSKFSQISELCCDCIKNLFINDKELALSLEVTRKISKMLKQRSFGVKPEVLNTMLSINLKEIKNIEEGDKKKLTHKEKMKLSRTERKKLKEKEQLEIDLDERKLSDRLQEKSKFQTQILEFMFLIYFKILKTNANLKLIPSVLEGLAKFAHLISLEFFDDLVTVMHEMVESDNLSFRAKLHCVKTVFVVLSGQGEALTIDPLRFYTSLYNILLNLNASGNADNTLLLIECIDMMFFRRKKQIPQSRLLAFIKRLSIVTLQLEPKSCALIQHVIRKLLAINKSTDLLFDNEYQFNGIYNPELPQADYANAQNTALWELHLLSRHYDSIISSTSNEILKQSEFTSQDAKLTNDFIIDEFNSREVNIIKTSEAPFIKHKNKNKKNKFKNKNKNKK